MAAELDPVSRAPVREAGEPRSEANDRTRDDAVRAESHGAATEELVRRLAQHAPAASRYKLEGEVARGGMGAILKVWDEDLRRHLAMKVVLAQGETASGATPTVNPKQLARFLEEAQVTGQLDHPGIVPVHELGLDADGRVYFTMKLVEGRDLEHIFHLVFEEKEGWNETRALGVILKACEAIAYAHAKGVIHRDLKPANIMVGSFGEVFVMDWGLARVLGKEDGHDIRIRPEFASSIKSVRTQRRDERDETPDSPIITMDGDVMGTPAYMAPEQARGEVEKLGPRSDVYSMGAMLYHLLARQPDVRVNNRAVLAMLLEGPPAPLAALRDDVPAELVAICEKAMARDPKDRYADTLELAEDLRAYLENRVVGAYETGAWARARKWVARNKRLAAASAGLFVAIILAIVVPLELHARFARREALVSDARVAMDLVASAERLSWWRPEDLDGLHTWLADADALASRRAEHEALLRELETDPAAAVRAGQLRELVQKTAPAVAALRPLIVAHEEFARTIDARSVSGPDAKRLWADAIAAIAKSPRYAGLVLTPQLGLVPIGEDPDSHLWEFALLQTGEPAQRGPDGKLTLKEEMGLVLVLIPAGTIRMGAQKTDPNGRNYDPGADENELPVHAVTLDAYFLSKYEMTQGQWERFTGRNPSNYTRENYDKNWGRSGKGWSTLHPVEQVSWPECEDTLQRLGLMLPTEAQWERGARADTESVWWTGDELPSLRDAGNVADSYGKTHGAAAWLAWEKDLDDGSMIHAEIGSYRPNPFGLHDMIGNVWEWCRERFGGYDLPVHAGDGERQAIDPRFRSYRGGGYTYVAWYARSAARGYGPPQSHDYDLGVRPARAVRP